jgi:hypothetical protein
VGGESTGGSSTVVRSTRANVLDAAFAAPGHDDSIVGEAAFEDFVPAHQAAAV